MYKLRFRYKTVNFLPTAPLRRHSKLTVVMIPILSLLGIPEVVVMTTFDVASGDKVGIITAHGFHAVRVAYKTFRLGINSITTESTLSSPCSTSCYTGVCYNATQPCMNMQCAHENSRSNDWGTVDPPVSNMHLCTTTLHISFRCSAVSKGARTSLYVYTLVYGVILCRSVHTHQSLISLYHTLL